MRAHRDLILFHAVCTPIYLYAVCTEVKGQITIQIECNRKSLDRAGSYTEELVLCSGLVDGGQCSQD